MINSTTHKKGTGILVKFEYHVEERGVSFSNFDGLLVKSKITRYLHDFGKPMIDDAQPKKIDFKYSTSEEESFNGIHPFVIAMTAFLIVVVSVVLSKVYTMSQMLNK